MAAVVDWVAADIARLQAGGVDAVMFGNEGDRPYLLKATPESLAAMATAIGVLKRDLKVPFGVELSVGPRRHRGARRRHRRRASGARSSPASMPPTWACGRPMRRGAAPAPRPRPRRLQAAVQHQCRVRLAARHAADRAARDQRGLLLAGRRHLRLRADDRPGRRQCRAHAREEGGEGHAGLRQHRRQHRQRAGHPRESPTAASSAPISRSTATPGMPSTATA